MNDAGSNRLKHVRLGLTVASIVALFVWLPYDSLADIAARAQADRFLLAAVLAAMLGLLDAQRVAVLLGLPASSQLANLRITFMAALTAQLPTGLIGSDIYRGIALRSLGSDSDRIASALIISRFMSLIALLSTFILVGVLVLAGLGSAPDLDGLTGATWLLAAALLALALLLPAAVFVFRHRLARLWTPLGDALQRVREIPPARFGVAALITAGLVIVRAATLWAAAGALGLALSFDIALLALSAGLLLALIPLTAGGVGPREAGIAGILILFGTGPGVAVLIALIFRAVALAGAGSGYLVSLLLGWLASSRRST